GRGRPAWPRVRALMCGRRTYAAEPRVGGADAHSAPRPPCARQRAPAAARSRAESLSAWRRFLRGLAAAAMTEREFRALFERVSNWGRWDDARHRGALNLLTPARVRDAARLVRSG